MGDWMAGLVEKHPSGSGHLEGRDDTEALVFDTSAGDHVFARGKAAAPGTAKVGFGSDATPVFSL